MNNRFKSYDYEKIYEKMSRPSYFFDGRQIIEKTKIENIGFIFFQIGKK